MQILHKKIDYYKRNDISKNQIILNLKKELENLRDRSEDMIVKVTQNLTGIKGYLQGHEQLLNKENALIRDISTNEVEDKMKIKLKMQDFCNMFMENIDSGITEIMKVSETIQSQFSKLTNLAKEIKSFDSVERQMIRAELMTAKNALKSVKMILDEDRKPFSILSKDLMDIYEEYRSKFELYDREIEE